MANGGKNIVGIVILVIIIAAGTSYGFMTFFASSNNSQQMVSKNNDIGTTYSLGDFVVNLAESRGYQYVKASIVVEVDRNLVVEELDKRSPQIRDNIISILREQNLQDIKEPGAKVIKNQIKMKLNQLLSSGEITNVWFTQLVVQ